MSKKYSKLTTTIKRPWLAEIVAGTKMIEYRPIKPYWTKRLATLTLPLELRLMNGMNPPVPEVTVLFDRITTNHRTKEYELHIRRVVGFKHLGQAPADTQALTLRLGPA
jgi:hypothetical protein